MVVSAILREIGIIGEAVNALPGAVTAKRPKIAWRQISAMRNFANDVVWLAACEFCEV
jgi:uncharacterized protein with HEPN domain